MGAVKSDGTCLVRFLMVISGTCKVFLHPVRVFFTAHTVHNMHACICICYVAVATLHQMKPISYANTNTFVCTEKRKDGYKDLPADLAEQWKRDRAKKAENKRKRAPVQTQILSYQWRRQILRSSASNSHNLSSYQLKTCSSQPPCHQNEDCNCKTF